MLRSFVKIESDSHQSVIHTTRMQLSKEQSDYTRHFVESVPGIVWVVMMVATQPLVQLNLTQNNNDYVSTSIQQQQHGHL